MRENVSSFPRGTLYFLRTYGMVSEGGTVQYSTISTIYFIMLPSIFEFRPLFLALPNVVAFADAGSLTFFKSLVAILYVVLT